MATNDEVKKKKSNLLKIVLIVLLVLIAGGYLYQKGQDDMREKVRQEQARQQLEQQRKQKIVELKDVIPHKTAELQIAYDELSNINSFHFLRSSEEKEQELAAQNKKIITMKEELDKLQRQLTQLENTVY